MNIEKTIRDRYSARTYSRETVSEEMRARIMDFAASIDSPFEPEVRYKWLDKEQLPQGEKLGTYGVIRGSKLYIGTAVEKHENAMEALGYSFEKLVLYMTSMGLGTCWLGGTFNKKAFTEAMDLKDNELFCIASPVGYPAEKKSIVEKIMRAGSGGDKRQPWENLFFENDFNNPLSKDAAGEYAFPLEMVRLAPSAANMQPWRIIKKNGVYHFFEQHAKGDETTKEIDMHRIDLGIAMCHFHMAAEEKGLKGHFKRADVSDIKEVGNMTYIISWLTE